MSTAMGKQSILSTIMSIHAQSNDNQDDSLVSSVMSSIAKDMKDDTGTDTTESNWLNDIESVGDLTSQITDISSSEDDVMPFTGVSIGAQNLSYAEKAASWMNAYQLKSKNIEDDSKHSFKQDEYSSDDDAIYYGDSKTTTSSQDASSSSQAASSSSQAASSSSQVASSSSQVASSSSQVGVSTPTSQVEDSKVTPTSQSGIAFGFDIDAEPEKVGDKVTSEMSQDEKDDYEMSNISYAERFAKTFNAGMFTVNRTDLYKDQQVGNQIGSDDTRTTSENGTNSLPLDDFSTELEKISDSYAEKFASTFGAHKLTLSNDNISSSYESDIDSLSQSTDEPDIASSMSQIVEYHNNLDIDTSKEPGLGVAFNTLTTHALNPKCDSDVLVEGCFEQVTGCDDDNDDEKNWSAISTKLHEYLTTPEQVNEETMLGALFADDDTLDDDTVNDELSSNEVKQYVGTLLKTYKQAITDNDSDKAYAVGYHLANVLHACSLDSPNDYDARIAHNMNKCETETYTSPEVIGRAWFSKARRGLKNIVRKGKGVVRKMRGKQRLPESKREYKLIGLTNARLYEGVNAIIEPVTGDRDQTVKMYPNIDKILLGQLRKNIMPHRGYAKLILSVNPIDGGDDINIRSDSVRPMLYYSRGKKNTPRKLRGTMYQWQFTQNSGDANTITTTDNRVIRANVKLSVFSEQSSRLPVRPTELSSSSSQETTEDIQKLRQAAQGVPPTPQRDSSDVRTPVWQYYGDGEIKLETNKPNRLLRQVSDKRFGRRAQTSPLNLDIRDEMKSGELVMFRHVSPDVPVFFDIAFHPGKSGDDVAFQVLFVRCFISNGGSLIDQTKNF